MSPHYVEVPDSAGKVIYLASDRLTLRHGDLERCAGERTYECVRELLMAKAASIVTDFVAALREDGVIPDPWR